MSSVFSDHIAEEALIRELKNNSIKAFDGIYQMYAKRLYCFCLQYTKSVEDSEEIVQDVFLKLWNIRNHIRLEESVSALLFTIAKNHLINASRTRINSPIYEDYVAHQESLTTNDVMQHIEYEEFVRKLKRAMSKLPKSQQEILRLSKFEQLSNKEVAKKLSLSEQTVKNQLSLGLKVLRQELLVSEMVLCLLLLVN
jgi:RNA polymerase sigma-70 factor (family 1)